MTILIVVAFLLGFIAGTVTTVSFTLHMATKSLSKKKKAVEEFISKAESFLNNGSVVEEKLSKVKEITQKQLDLQGQLEQPQKSGLHGKYKSILLSEISHLEEEKMDILRSLLNSGHDPVLTVGKADGTTETMKLSEFLYQAGVISAPAKTPPATPTATSAPTKKQFGKFTVYSNTDKDKKTDS